MERCNYLHLGWVSCICCMPLFCGVQLLSDHVCLLTMMTPLGALLGLIYIAGWRAAISSMVTVAEILKSGQWAVERSKSLPTFSIQFPQLYAGLLHIAHLFPAAVAFLFRLRFFCAAREQITIPRSFA